MIESIVQALPLAIVASIPLLLAVEGELVAQRSGIINLGIEGMMLVAALAGAVSAQATGSVIAGFAGGIAAALLVAMVFGFFVVELQADQIVTGTAINLFALGATGFVYRELRNGPFFAEPLPSLRFDPFIAIAWLIVPAALGLLIWSSAFGLRLRACGENPEAVIAAGRSVRGHRGAALAIEALLAGAAGAYLSLGLSSGFAENLTSGRGFIALSIVIFGRWKFKGAIVGTMIFGLAAALQYAMQAASIGVPFHLLLALPYVVTLLILFGVAGKVRAPESLGR